MKLYTIVFLWLSPSSASVHHNERNDTYQLIPVLTIVTIVSVLQFNMFKYSLWPLVSIDNSFITFYEVVCPSYYNTTALGKF